MLPRLPPEVVLDRRAARFASVLPGPIVLNAHAPSLPGTYRWDVGWFGKVAYPNPSVMLEHYLQWHFVPGPEFQVYSNDVSGPAITVATASPSRRAERETCSLPPWRAMQPRARLP